MGFGDSGRFNLLFGELQMNTDDYLKMQKGYYEKDASKWSLENKNPVVGNYHNHNQCLSANS